MKRKIDFKILNDNYQFWENGNVVFEILKSDMQFDIKNFYMAFFALDKDYTDICLENCAEGDKEATRVYQTVQELLGGIIKKLEESDAGEENEGHQ